MVYTYTAVFKEAKDGNKFYARIPDIKGCATTGRDLQDAVAQITDALAACLLVYEDDNMPIPAPTAQTDMERGDGDILSLIMVDTIAYRAQTDTRSVRKNVSLPSWLAALAERDGVNCSKVLREALLQHYS